MEGIVVAVVLGGLLALDRWVTARQRTNARESAGAQLRADARKQADAGFDLTARLPDLREYVRLSSQLFRLAAGTPPPISQLPAATGRRIDYAKRSILLALARLGIEMPVLKTRFASLGGAHAGSVHQEPDGSWALDIDRSFENDLEGILSVAAHEVAHVALNKHRIRLDPLQRNEELTDTAAVLAGFGPVMLRTVLREDLSETREQTRLQSQTLGYLPPAAIAYLTTLTVELAGGEAEFFLEHVPPWQRESVVSYIALRDEWRERASRLRGAKVACFACGISLQLPKEEAAIRVRCSNCRYRHYVPARVAS